MSKVIISYRSEDTGSVSGRLDDFLVNRFGDGKVKLGLAGVIQPGDDFVEAIEGAVKNADVLVVLIGNQWTEGDWLNNAEDYDHIAIKTALEAKTRIMPVTIDGASMPTADQVPEAFASLTRRAGININTDSFRDDAGQLGDQLAKHVQGESTSAPASKPKSTPAPTPQPAPKPSVFTQAPAQPSSTPAPAFTGEDSGKSVQMPEFFTDFIRNLIKNSSDFVAIIGLGAVLFAIVSLIDLDYSIYNIWDIVDDPFVYSIILSALYGVAFYVLLHGISVATPWISTKTAMAVVGVYAAVTIINLQATDFAEDGDGTAWLFRIILAGGIAFVLSDKNTMFQEEGELRLNQQAMGMVFVGIIIITFAYSEFIGDILFDADSFTDARVRTALAGGAQGAAIAGLLLYAFKSTLKEQETALPPTE